VAPELELALLLFVFDGVEERGVVGGPSNGSDALDLAGKGFARREVPDVEGVLAEARGVGCVGEPAAVVGDVGCADRKKRMALGKLIAVEEDLFGNVVAGDDSPRSPNARNLHPTDEDQSAGTPDLGHPEFAGGVADLRQWIAYCWPSTVRV
jgi:hypothetical protein